MSCKCALNLLVVQNFIQILFRDTSKTPRSAVILLTRVHCYAIHYLSQLVCALTKVGTVLNQLSSAEVVIKLTSRGLSNKRQVKSLVMNGFIRRKTNIHRCTTWRVILWISLETSILQVGVAESPTISTIPQTIVIWRNIQWVALTRFTFFYVIPGDIDESNILVAVIWLKLAFSLLDALCSGPWLTF